MGRLITKTDLLTAASENYEKLNALIDGLTEEELATPFDFSSDEAKNMLRQSHDEVMKLAETFSNEELFSKGVYSWVGGSTLGSFIHAGMPHCDQACSVL